MYVVLRSLDKMPLILEQSYKDAPEVSTKLIKFLSTNASIEAVDKLVEQAWVFKVSIVEQNK